MHFAYFPGVLCQTGNFTDEDRRFGDSDMLVQYVAVLVDDEDRGRGVHGVLLVDLVFVRHSDPAHEVLISMLSQNAIGIGRIHADHSCDNTAPELGSEFSEVRLLTNTG